MELLFLFSLTLLPLILIPLYTKFSNSRQNNLPPGNMGWPIIGESLDFISCGKKGAPEKFISDRTSLYSSEIFKTRLFGQPVVFISGAAANKLVFTTENKYVTAWWPSSLEKMFPFVFDQSTNDQERVRLRKLMSGFFRAASLKERVGIMDLAAKQHIETCWEGMQQVSVYPLVKSFTMVAACKAFASIQDPKIIAKLSEPYDALMAGIMSIPIDLPGTPLNRAVKATKIIRDVLLQVIKERKVDTSGSSENDLVYHLLSTPDENGRFSKEMEIVDMILGFIVAGHDPASRAITFTMKYMAELPHVYDAVYKEQMEIAMTKQPGELLNWEDLQKMKYTWNVASEAMRLVPPSPISFRLVVADFTLAGFSIPKGFKLIWSPSGTHRNSEYFSDPEKFDPTRFDRTKLVPYTYVPFGAGPRMCPAIEYARLKILVFMYNVVTKFKWEKLIPNEKTIVNPKAKPEKGLPIRLYPH